MVESGRNNVQNGLIGNGVNGKSLDLCDEQDCVEKAVLYR